MNVEDIKKENYSNILHAELKFNLEHDYIVYCRLIEYGWDKKGHCFSIYALENGSDEIITGFHYGSIHKYKADLLTIKNIENEVHN